MSHRPLWPAVGLALLSVPAWASDKDRPDTSGILRLIGRFSAGAHACYAGEVVLTCAHVIDPRPFEQDVPLLPYRYSDGRGNAGVVAPVSTERCSDLAVMALRPGFTARPYPRATTEPKPGDRVAYIGFDFRSKRKAYVERVFDAEVLRVIAGHLILDEPGDYGSSGSCVLNQAGEVVAINCWGKPLHNGEEVEGVVGIWGEWLGSCR